VLKTPLPPVPSRVVKSSNIHLGNGLRQVRTQKTPFLSLKNDSKYHERRINNLVESRNFQSTQSSHAACSNLCLHSLPHTLSVLSLLRTFYQVLTYLYCSIIVCCVQRHSFSVTCNVKQLLWKHLRIYQIIVILFTCNDAVLLNTVRDRQVTSDCRRPETARTTRVYKVHWI